MQLMISRQPNVNFYNNPIIAAVRNKSDLEDSFQSNVSTVFILHSSILNARHLVELCREHGKYVLVHLDMVEGLGSDMEAVRFIKEVVNPHGVISTRTNVLKHARECELYTIQRCFCVDSAALRSGIKAAEQICPDAIELLPGIVSKAVYKFVSQLNRPIITGGLISTKEDIIASLNAGAMAISTSCKDLWNK